jgi:hypothetical protein
MLGKTELNIEVNTEYLETFERGSWQLEPGDYELRVCLNFGNPGLLVTLKV